MHRDAAQSRCQPADLLSPTPRIARCCPRLLRALPRSLGPRPLMPRLQPQLRVAESLSHRRTRDGRASRRAPEQVATCSEQHDCHCLRARASAQRAVVLLTPICVPAGGTQTLAVACDSALVLRPANESVMSLEDAHLDEMSAASGGPFVPPVRVGGGGMSGDIAKKQPNYARPTTSSKSARLATRSSRSPKHTSGDRWKQLQASSKLNPVHTIIC